MISETYQYLVNGKSKYNVCHRTNTTGATSGAGTVYPSGAHESIPGLQWDLCCSIFSVQCFVDCCLSFFYWPLLYFLFFDFWFLIIPLVSSISTFKNQTGFSVTCDFIKSYFGYISDLWCLTPLTTIFQLYRDGQFQWWRKPKYKRKITTCHKSLTHFIT